MLQKAQSLMDLAEEIVDGMSTEDDELGELGLLIAEGSINPSQIDIASPSTTKLDLELGIYEASAAVSGKTNPIAFWKVNSAQFPLLYSIALDIICVPVTEVTSERLFSFLNIVFNKLRAKLDPGIVDDILFLRWNKALKFLLNLM